jgi:hypothetical protein
MDRTGDDALTCLFCGSVFGELARICPRCGHHNAGEGRHCTECGARLVRDCPACGTGNWVLADHCAHCGRNLSVVEEVARRWQQTTQERLRERRATIAAVKEAEERASRRRMAPMMEAERQRQEALARAEAERRERDRQIYLFVVVGIVVVVVLMIAVLIALAVVGAA